MSSGQGVSEHQVLSFFVGEGEIVLVESHQHFLQVGRSRVQWFFEDVDECLVISFKGDVLSIDKIIEFGSCKNNRKQFFLNLSKSRLGRGERP